jgi:hypothetical protein
MAGTYSKYEITPYYSLSSILLLSNDGTQSYAFGNDYVYTDLIDNQNKLISPKKLRDSILSIWDTTPFKETTVSGSNVYYIGIDSGNQSEDLKRKIYLGKRNYTKITGTVSVTNEIMTPSLLNSEVDLFLFNTKKDTLSQLQTRISILSGTNSALYNSAPYISSDFVVGSTSSNLSLNLVNPKGDISILSRGIDPFTGFDTSSGGTVSLNNIVFPSFQESILSDSTESLNSKILSWYNGGLTWSKIEINSTGYVGVTGSEINFYGDPSNLNGFPLEMSDNRRVPIKIGDIEPGSTFSNNSISDLLSRIIYEYQPPECELYLTTNQYLEVGTNPKIFLDYVIYKRTNDLLPTLFTNMIPSSYAPISSPYSFKIRGQIEGAVITPLQATTSTFTMKVDDGINSNSITKSVTGIYPYFYGFSTYSTITIANLSGLTKKIEPREDKSYDITGSGNFFFIYDKDYGTLSNIYNAIGATISASFSYTTKVLSSPSGYWQSKEFYVYKWSNVDQIGPPSEIFQFEY